MSPTTTEASSSPLTSRKTWRSRFSAYGRTSYGGNPVSQQTLPAKFLYATPYIVIPVFAVVAIIFIILGIFLLIESDRQYEVREKYSEIHRYQYVPSDPTVNINQGIKSFVVDNITHSQGTRTRVQIEIQETMKAPVYLYYTMENFFQNFRDFHNGRSRHLLTGKERRSGTYRECLPIERPGFLDGQENKEVHIQIYGETRTLRYQNFVYNPCGIAPWSLFNDSFILYRLENNNTTNTNESIIQTENRVLICNTSDFGPTGEPLGQSVSLNQCSKKGISWLADEKVRFKPLRTRLDRWSLRYPYPNDDVYLTNGWYANEPGHSLTDPLDYDLQVWLRGTVLPNFRKLFRIINVDLVKGQYIMDIDEFFDVTTLQGSKGFLLRTSSWIGHDGFGLGIAFLIVGGAAFVLGVTFSIEFALRWRVCRNSLPEPKARWYIFDPNSTEMRIYYEKRTQRYEKVSNGSEEENR